MIITPEWATAIDDYMRVLRAAAQSPNTIATRRQHLQMMARRIGSEPWDVTRDQLAMWAGDQQWMPATRHARRMTFRGFYRWAKKAGRIKKDPSKGLPKIRQQEPSHRPTPDRVYHEALMRSRGIETVWLELGSDHGLRRAEMAVVHTDDVFKDLLGHSLRVHGKGGKTRIVPLTVRMARILLDIEPGYLAPGAVDGHISAQWLGIRVTRLMEGDWSTHSLRHRFGTRNAKAGNVQNTKELMGHRSIDTTMVYVEVDRADMRAQLLAAAS
jgi:integrase/recombinase XerC